MDGYTFERCLVSAIVEMSKARGWKAKPLAEKAWPQAKSAGTKWRLIRNGTEPRGLQVCDAYDLAQAMGISFVEICGLAQAMLLKKTPPPSATKSAEDEASALEDTSKKAVA